MCRHFEYSLIGRRYDNLWSIHPQDLIATGVEDEYAILKKLGQGSFGEVYLGQNRKTRMHVAIKSIKLSDKTKMEEFGLWRQEAKLHAEINHENIIKFIK